MYEALFPGANVLVYEWVESDYTPERWSELSNTEDGSSEGISGTPRSTRYYVTKTFFDNNKQATVTKYYFWVNDTVLTPNLPTRTLSARQVQNIISDPIGQGYTFTAFVNSNAIAYANVDPLLDDNNIVHHVEWATTDTPLPKHDEWIILKEGDEKSKPNTILKTKLIDSLIGRDAKSNNVPDNTLSVTQQYGLEDGQSMIKNRTTVLTAVIENINAVLAQHKIVSTRDLQKFDLKEPTPTSASPATIFLIPLIEADFFEILLSKANGPKTSASKFSFFDNSVISFASIEL